MFETGKNVAYYTKEEIYAYENTLEVQCDYFRKKVFADCPHSRKIPTTYKLCNKLINLLPITNKSKILILFSPELLILLNNKFPGAEITLLTGSNVAANLKWGKNINVIEIQSPYNNIMNWGEIHEMQFDIVIGNPPYQLKDSKSSNGKDLYARFYFLSLKVCKGQLALVLPSAWTGSGAKATKLRHSLTKDVNLTHYWPTTEYFNVQFETCAIICDLTKTYSGTSIKDKNNNVTKVDTRKFGYIPTGNVNIISVIEKLQSYNKMDNLVYSGNLYINKFMYKQSYDTGIKFIIGVGKQGESINFEYSSKIPKGTAGFGEYKLVIPGVASVGKIGAIKHADRTYVGGHSVKFIKVDKDEADNMKSYLESKLVKSVIAAVKSNSCPNSKWVFSAVPIVDFSKRWTDNDLYDYFKLTQKEIDYIEQSVK